MVGTENAGIKPDVVAARPMRFFNEYRTDKATGETKVIEWVVWTKPGSAGRDETEQRVKDIIGTAKWKIFQPAYEAWKEGSEIPLEGTPLAAWAGLTPEQAECVRRAGVKTVEELADANERTIAAIRMPNARRYKDDAKRFIDSKDQFIAAGKIEEMEKNNEAMASELEELRAQMREMNNSPKDDTSPRPRGRPPKAKPDEEEAA